MTDDQASKSEVVIYQTEVRRTRIECRFADETIWLAQARVVQAGRIPSIQSSVTHTKHPAAEVA